MNIIKDSAAITAINSKAGVLRLRGPGKSFMAGDGWLPMLASAVVFTV